MAGIQLELDAAASNPDGTNPGTALLLTDTTNGFNVTGFDLGTPEPEYQLASSVDTEGSLPVSARHGNRSVQITVRVRKTTDLALHTAIDTIGKKIGKIFRQGGTLQLTLPSTIIWYFDLCGGDRSLRIDRRMISSKTAEIVLRLPAKPYVRGAPITRLDNIQTTLPILTWTESSLVGDVSALGTLVIDNDATVGNDWWGLLWGVEDDSLYTHTSSSGSGGLFYEAESRTVLGGSATAIGPTGASGSGNNVVRNTVLATSYQAILSTQATGGGAHLSHVGAFRVWARVQVPGTNTGTVNVALEWSDGDFRRFTQNTGRSITSSQRGTWQRVDLGIVTITKTAQGTQRWEGRVVAKTSLIGPTNQIDVDWIMLQPVDVASGMVSAVARTGTSTAFSARDEFDQTAGNLTGKTLPIGGTWTFASGDTDDFTMDTTNKRAQRATTLDAGARLIYASTPSLTTLAAQVDIFHPRPVGSLFAYIPFRWVDANNYGYVALKNITTPGFNLLTLNKVVAGAEAGIATAVVPAHWGIWKTLRIMVQADGKVFVWHAVQGTGFSAPVLQATHSVFATGGTLASGKVGIGEYHDDTATITRQYDNFAVWVPPVDAAVYAGQSLEVRHDRAIREDSSGVVWQTPSSYEGDYLRVPQAGQEGRTARFMVTPLYNPEIDGVWQDDRTDDLSAILTYIPRSLG